MSQAPHVNDGVFISDATEQYNADPGSTTTESREASLGFNVGEAQATIQSGKPVSENSHSRAKTSPDVDASLFFTGVVRASEDVSLSVEGEEYLNQVKKIINDVDNKFRVTRLNNTGSYIVTHDNNNLAVPFVFQETLSRPNRPFYPYSESLKRVLENAVAFVEGKKDVVTPIMITPQDYPKAKAMALSIVFMIKDTFNNAATVNALERCKFRIITDQARAINNLKQVYPNGVIPYTQYAISVEIAKNDNRNSCFNREEDENWVPLFTIGGYTEFIKNRSHYGEPITFTPLVNISSVAIRYTSIALLPTIIRVAYDSFIRNKMYLAPFRHFDNNEYNLGNLALSEDPNTSLIKNSQEFDEFVHRILYNPVLCVEFTQGEFVYPGLSLIIDPDRVMVLKQILTNSFTNEYANAISGIPNNMIASGIGYYTGYAKYDGNIVDTRNIDYFKICRGNVNNRGLLDAFLGYSSRPEDRIKAIVDAGFDSIIDGQDCVQSLYTTVKYILDGQSVQAFLNLTRGLSFFGMEYNNTTNVFSTESLRNIGNFLNDNISYTGNMSSGNGFYGSQPLFGNFNAGNSFNVF